MEYWKNIWEKSFKVRNYRLVLHLLFWGIYFFCFSFYTYYLLRVTNWRGSDLVVNWLISMFFNIGLIVFCYYLSIGTAYKYLVIKRNYTKFFVSFFLNLLLFCVLLLGVKYLKEQILTFVHIDSPSDYDLFSSTVFSSYFWITLQVILSYFALLCLPIATKFFRDQLRHQHRENALEKQNLQMQMDFLKAQIHPHFLFNTLNNIYSLNLNNQSERASEMISRLADLLRYVLYKSQEEFIQLHQELEMLQNFVKLEQIRSDQLELSVALPDLEEITIFLPPFLLLPLVENAFKHGVNSQLDNSFISINLQLTPTTVQLKVKNSYDSEYRSKKVGGLGLKNLRRRLEYYYLDTYSLTLSETADQYEANLIIPITCPKYSA